VHDEIAAKTCRPLPPALFDICSVPKDEQLSWLQVTGPTGVPVKTLGVLAMEMWSSFSYTRRCPFWTRDHDQRRFDLWQ
jgi:hypothetical protein